MCSKSTAPTHKNVKQQKGTSAKVVDVEDLVGEKGVYCRCWESKTFPLCDGSHTAYNARTGDNVGPLIVKRGEPEK